ncbi:MAG TPA: hypothetical protein VMB84_08130 [Stellaceae bacterium]|nr:hypothetical protein [Stellaceae bacterium]
MKTLLTTLGVVALAAILNTSPAAAGQYGQPSTGTWHYEWQYHYVGHHAHYQGDWVLVK